MSFLHIRTVRPDKHKDRISWNVSWEEDLEIYATFEHKLPELYLHNPKFTAYGTQLEAVLDHINDTRKAELIVLQDDASRRALARLAADDFGDKWAALAVDIRKKHILDAIFKTSTTGPDMEDCRKWCPEITLDHLGNDGQAYLDLLMHLIDSKCCIDGKRDLIFFPHLIVDAIFLRIKELQGARIYQKLLIDRTYFITMVIWRTYLSFHDLDEIPRFYKIPNLDGEKESIAARHIRPQFTTPESKKMYMTHLQNMKEMSKAKGESAYCWKCGLSEAALPTGTSLKACSKCKDFGRKVLYCSRICQKEDWKTGLGNVPHKMVCGKAEVSPKNISTSKPEISISISEHPMRVQPLSNIKVTCKKTPALLYQMALLKKEEHVVYFKHPLSDIGITIPVYYIRQDFIANRQAAFETGDVSAIKKMFPLLKAFANKFAPNTYSLNEQLEAEYGKFGSLDDSDT